MNLVKTTIVLLLFLLCIGMFYRYRTNFKRVPDVLLGFAGILVVALVWSRSTKESFQTSCSQRALVDDIINLRKPEYMFNMDAGIKVADRHSLHNL